MAPVKAAAGTTALTKWEEKMAAEAVAAVATTGKSTQNTISIKGGVMKYQGDKIKDSKLDCVVLDHVFINSYFLGVYDADNPEAPDCFAIGRVEEDMVPHAHSLAPQSPTCAECRWNQYGTAEKGKGKACKNQRRLGLITEDSLVQIAKAEIAILHVPPTSVKAYDAVVKETASTLSRAPMGVVMQIDAHSHEVKNVEVGFDVLRKVEESKHFPKDKAAGFEALFKHKELAAKDVEAPYDKKVPTDKDKTPAKSAGPGNPRKFAKPTASKTAAKKSSR